MTEEQREIYKYEKEEQRGMKALKEAQQAATFEKHALSGTRRILKYLRRIKAGGKHEST
jgi:hypothetical protein